MGAEVMPLAVAMMVGPEIIASIILVTNPEAARVSAGYVLGIAISVALGTAIAIGLVSLLEIDVGSSSDAGSAGTIIELILIGVLIVIAIRQHLSRSATEPPEWLGTLPRMEPGRALKTGLAIIPLMPTDVILMFVVAVNVEQHRGSPLDALPFVGLTILLAALPLLAYLLFRRSAVEAMPGARHWINRHGWLVSITAYAVFVVLLVRA